MSRADGNAIAIVLARAGSRGLPGKNVAPVAGRPCLVWTLEAALASRRVRRVVVSTDDERAAMVALGMDCEIVRRPASLAGDDASVDAAARHALEQCHASPTDAVAILYASVPVRPPGLIDRAVERVLATGCDSVQSYVRVGKFHPWWTVRLIEDGASDDPEQGMVRPWEGDVLNHGVYRRQDLPPAFVPDGGVIAVTRRALMLEIPGVEPGPHAFLGADRRGIATEPGEVIDVDSRIDLLVADALLRERHGIAGDAHEAA